MDIPSNNPNLSSYFQFKHELREISVDKKGLLLSLCGYVYLKNLSYILTLFLLIIILMINLYLYIGRKEFIFIP